eukprot:1716632-Pyramimonas_sp.AAC.3
MQCRATRLLYDLGGFARPGQASQLWQLPAATSRSNSAPRPRSCVHAMVVPPQVPATAVQLLNSMVHSFEWTFPNHMPSLVLNRKRPPQLCRDPPFAARKVQGRIGHPLVEALLGFPARVENCKFGIGAA